LVASLVTGNQTNNVTEWIQLQVATTVYQCLHGMAPAYLADRVRQSLRQQVNVVGLGQPQPAT